MASAGWGRVSAPRIEAIRAGEAVLEQGGSAIDAAVAACFVLGVVEPYMTGPGAVAELVHLDADGRCGVVDGAARAPMAATATMYGQPGGPGAGYGWPRMPGRRNEIGGTAIAAPRLVAALAAAHQRWGRLPWPDLLQPAIELADEGWNLDFFSAACLADALPDLRRDSATAQLLDPSGTGPSFGVDGGPRTVRNPELADTLRAVALDGPDALRSGPIARDIVGVAERDGGVLGAADLDAAEAAILDEASQLTRFRGWSVYGSPLASGATTAAQMLGILDRTTSGAAGRPQWYAEVAAACAVAFDDRLTLLSGDDARDDLDRLLRDEALDSAAGRAVIGRFARGAPSASATAAVSPSTATTHLSVIDGAGNAVALTTTLLSLFGAAVAVPGRGFCLNNAMMWFDPRPGKRNSIRPGARALSAVSPLVLVSPDGERRLALGALGGRKIISAVAQIAALRVEAGIGIDVAVDLPRVHVEPAEAQLDERAPADAVTALRERGFVPVLKRYGPTTLSMARANGVERGPDGVVVGIDKRAADTWSYGR